jgi:hypothetical protein
MVRRIIIHNNGTASRNILTCDHYTASGVQISHTKGDSERGFQTLSRDSDDEEYLQRCMDIPVIQINSESICKKSGRSQICPFLRVMAVIVSDDNSTASRMRDTLQHIFAKALETC